MLEVTAPTWRPDLTDPGRPRRGGRPARSATTRLPSVAADRRRPGDGLTEEQRLRRSVSRAARRRRVRRGRSPSRSSRRRCTTCSGWPPTTRAGTRLGWSNPLSDDEPELRTSLLPGLLATARPQRRPRQRATSRCSRPGLVFLAARPTALAAADPGVEHRPTDAEIAALYDAVPDQPRHLAVVLAGDAERRRLVGRRAGRRPGPTPSRPRGSSRGRRESSSRARGDSRAVASRAACAELVLDGRSSDHAGELHPRVVTALGLPARTARWSSISTRSRRRRRRRTPGDLDVPAGAARRRAGRPGRTSGAAAVEAARPAGAGELLESIRLFDVYADERGCAPSGAASLAFALRFARPTAR